jgi:hypothetical protein
VQRRKLLKECEEIEDAILHALSQVHGNVLSDDVANRCVLLLGVSMPADLHQGFSVMQALKELLYKCAHAGCRERDVHVYFDVFTG